MHNLKTDCMLATRRQFIRSAALTSASFLVSQQNLLATESKGVQLTILHTNDVHSRLDPFTDGNNKGKGEGRLKIEFPTNLQKGARIAQLIFFPAEAEGQYDGQYQGENL